MTSRSKSFIFLLIAVFQFSGCSAIDLPNIDTPIPYLTGIRIVKNSDIETNYENTRCIKFLSANKNIGLLCSSSSRDFMKDFGVVIDSPENELSMHGADLKIATGMAIYDMKPTYLGGRILYATETDCDEYNDPIYRATSTCHVAIMPLNKNAFIYSNFVIKNHIDSTVGITTQDIENFWIGLKIHQNLIVKPAIQ